MRRGETSENEIIFFLLYFKNIANTIIFLFSSFFFIVEIKQKKKKVKHNLQKVGKGKGRVLFI
jgi:hypothetical protein